MEPNEGGATIYFKDESKEKIYIVSDLSLVLTNPKKDEPKTGTPYCKKLEFEVLSSGNDFFFHEWLSDGTDGEKNAKKEVKFKDATIEIKGFSEGEIKSYKIELTHLICIKISEKFDIDKDTKQLSTRVTLSSMRTNEKTENDKKTYEDRGNVLFVKGEPFECITDNKGEKKLATSCDECKNSELDPKKKTQNTPITPPPPQKIDPKNVVKTPPGGKKAPGK